MRVGLRYCGGCNPVYDREGYVAAIRRTAGTRIDWGVSGAEDVAAFLIVNGCPRECILEGLGARQEGCRVVLVQDDRAAPEEIVRRLLDADRRV